MAFSNTDRAVAQTGTALSSSIVTSLQTDAEDDIRAELQVNGLDINPSPTPLLLQQASMHWTCRNILNRHKHDGTLPNMLVLGGATAQVTIDQSISYHDQKGRVALDRYVGDQTTNDEGEADSLVTTTGED